MINMYLSIGQVGSSIHGKLLSPNDIDIYIGYKLPFVTKQFVKCFRLGKLNFICYHGQTVDEYVNSFDMSILCGYKSLFTRKLHLSPEAKVSLLEHHINQLPRLIPLGFSYNGYKGEELDTLEVTINRYLKYKKKLPSGWTISPLPRVEEALQYLAYKKVVEI